MSLTLSPVQRIKKAGRFILVLCVSCVFIVGLLRVVMILRERPNTYAIADVPNAPVALVFGAGLTYEKEPSDPLRDRIDAAISLYEAGKVQKLLMSGDNSTIYYNEPEAMRQYAISQGIPDTDIVLDYAGRRTYDSCYRAQAIFGLTDVILVTQNYHLPRALFLCNQLNLNANGVPADQTHYLRHRYVYWRIREVAASVAAYYDIYFSKPVPILGDYEPIFP
jgi:SanA protein